MIGQIVNYRYEVLEKIGDGDLFSVYKARDKVLNRLVALKVLSRELANDRRFAVCAKEAYASAATLDHPNIAQIIDTDSTVEDFLVVTECVRGVNVKERIHRAGPMAVPLVLDIMISVLEALDYAHANRIVHGDLRPQDVIVSPDGEVKVTDFALVGALRRCPEVANKHIMRSVYYQAPEISEGAEPAPASDLYSAGVIMYEMLTGVLPFDGATAVAVALKQVKNEPVPPRSINAAIPKSLNDLVLRAIEKSPDDRFSSAAEMLADLRSIRDALKMGKPLSIPQPVVSAKQVEKEEDDDYTEPVESTLKTPLLWLIGLFVVVVIASLGLTLHFQKGMGSVVVPALLGKTRDEAMVEAKKAGLQLIDEGEAYSSTYPVGQVCSVVPPASSTVSKDNPVVRIKISKGPSQKSVPDVTGMSESEANDAVVDKGFTVGKVTEQYSEKVPVNAVIAQDPPSGMMAEPGSTVALVVSLGPKPEPVSSEESSDSEPERTSTKHTYRVTADVANDAEGSQEVKIVVVDDRGENVAYQRYHDPGERVTQTVTAYGSSPRIMVYVGGDLVSDNTY